MIPISLTWKARGKVILIKWNGFFSFERKKGKRVKTIFKIPIPCRSGAKRDEKTPFPRIRRIDLKEALSFLREWKLQRVEGTLSFQDPMVKGIRDGGCVLSGRRRMKNPRQKDEAL